MKNKRLPSAETVGRSSASFELMLNPRFSILIIVEAVIIFSFCAIKPVSLDGWAGTMYTMAHKMVAKRIFFMGLDL